MARQNKSLAGSFGAIEQAEKMAPVSASLPAESSKSTKPVNAVTSETEASEGYMRREPSSIREMKAQLESEKARETFEDKYARTTYFVDRELKKKIDQYSRFEQQGFKTRFVNYALRMALEEYEKDNGIE